ncbi:MAG TPA: hypothetical protein PLN34_09170 [Alloprevotella sp.]|nr:hypothetical protein [Alloprevotella sp.]
MKRFVSLFFIFSLFTDCWTQSVEVDPMLQNALKTYFSGYKLENYRPYGSMKADSMCVDEQERNIIVYTNEAFSSQPFTPQTVSRIYKDLSRRLPPPYNTYRLSLRGKRGMDIEELIPNIYKEDGGDKRRLWGEVDYKGNPWVQNLSCPFSITQGLAGRHLMVWPSHGRYYKAGDWVWQRPYLFCTTEDLFTQSFVYPFLIPMLENAGAVVYCPRERDIQTAEAVVDNDGGDRQGRYEEFPQSDYPWSTLSDSAFAPPMGLLTDSVLPFRLGTARWANATNRRSRLSSVSWTPHIPRRGRYAVYVSYVSRPNSVSDARYTVYHCGGRSQFSVNQQMGGGTWLYLGTFEFEEGENRDGRVVLTNQSNYRGVVTADGVRFGGGVGQTDRDGYGTSGMPRFLEAARYHAQWSGLPDSLFNADDGTNDYNDDLRSRSNLLNYLGGGSVYQPRTAGGGVPFELALAVHSDAGVRHDGGIFGTLGICTTVDGEGKTTYQTGLSRKSSFDLADMLMSTVTNDLSATFPVEWTRRELWDRNYSETRSPHVPSAILEMLSHQNYADMKLGHDPLFKFTMARAVYKALLRYVNYSHGIRHYAVQPLPVCCFSALLSKEGNEVRLSWKPRTDKIEKDLARPEGYVVYTKMGDGDFDNGHYFAGKTEITLPVNEGVQYCFKVTAVNAGGESFPSETLSVFKARGGTKHVLIVNAFERLGGPAQVETADSVGFDLKKDMGVPYHYTAAYSGEQLNYDPSAAGNEGPAGLGYCGREMMGKIFAGNTFDYAVVHGSAIAASGSYSFSSCGKEAVMGGWNALGDYDMIDYIAGLEKDVSYNLRSYKTFPPSMCRILTDYLREGGRLFVTGAYIGSDMQQVEERDFTEKVLKYRYAGSARSDSTDFVRGLNLQFPIFRSPSSLHYAVSDPDILMPAGSGAFSVFAYGGGAGAGVAYSGKDYRVVAAGFPFECIRDASVREKAMEAIIRFLTE